ncbi:MAG: formylglycine-generating enzyme family protein [Gemmatimonadota bacterium]|nr:formylglycine-generating enzyme family protein [Gemmatimonadota bacterium]
MIKRVILILVSAMAVVLVCAAAIAAMIYLRESGRKGPETPLANYTAEVPGTGIELEMVYVPGGEFEMGSPEDEPGRDEDEGPVRKVRVNPFWIGKTEVTWELYEEYAFKKDSTMLDAVTLPSAKISPTWMLQGAKWLRQQVELSTKDLDAITRPSPYYGDFYHGMGRGKKPAIGMSWINAVTFCKWLSKKTGHSYRLPTEAEWEFACRAGSSSSYSFGKDVRALDDYGWHEDNSDWETMKVGQSKPNALGIHDMHGNVWEFCLDMYDPEYLSKLREDNVCDNPRGPKREGKPVLRGGSWDDSPEALRSASRLEQLDWWNERDPQRPRGMWWLVDGNVVGFRVLREVE